ncbi:MAG: hypothetical protein ABIP55_15230 [Tepidisphaeraceae bacterium]
MLWNPRPVSVLLLPIFLTGQLICFCATTQAAAHTGKDEADHACCVNEAGDADRGKTPGDKSQHDCDHCGGVQALIAQKTADLSQAFKLLVAIGSPFIQTTSIASPGIELSSISKSFTLERPPPELFVWHRALLN